MHACMQHSPLLHYKYAVTVNYHTSNYMQEDFLVSIYNRSSIAIGYYIASRKSREGS